MQSVTVKTLWCGHATWGLSSELHLQEREIDDRVLL